MYAIRVIVAAAVCAATMGAAEAASIRYTGFVLTDVSLGGVVYPGAQVWLRFDGSTRNVVPYSDQTGQGFMNQTGHARVRIVSGSTTINASIDDHQLYVFFDLAHSSAGFGSVAGGHGYPLMLASPAFDGAEGLSSSLVGAVANIANNAANKASYTPLTSTLSADLRSPTVLAGTASSCAAVYDPANVTCPLPPSTPPVSPAPVAQGVMPVPVAISTDQGDLLMYEPYFLVITNPPGISNTARAANWGMFWSEILDE
ncbi:MAG: hypothetical protein JO133_11545 [Burkholderiaceae bacterium]|nr:hypothetical protein [Burkholderiaceae bacterium]